MHGQHAHIRITGNAKTPIASCTPLHPCTCPWQSVLVWQHAHLHGLAELGGLGEQLRVQFLALRLELGHPRLAARWARAKSMKHSAVATGLPSGKRGTVIRKCRAVAAALAVVEERAELPCFGSTCSSPWQQRSIMHMSACFHCAGGLTGARTPAGGRSRRRRAAAATRARPPGPPAAAARAAAPPPAEGNALCQVGDAWAGLDRPRVSMSGKSTKQLCHRQSSLMQRLSLPLAESSACALKHLYYVVRGGNSQALEGKCYLLRTCCQKPCQPTQSLRAAGLQGAWTRSVAQ